MREADLTPDALAEETARMVECMTHPAYVEAMKTLKSTENEKRLGVVMELLTPEALAERGVPIPKGMRISSRYFEPEIPAVEAGELATGEKGLLRELYERDPDVLDRLRITNLDAVKALAAVDLHDDVINPAALCVCACGGGGVCGGVGGG